MAALMTRRRFTAAEYERMVEAGILGESDRVELIAGEIVEMSPIGPRHADCVTALTDLIGERVGRRVSIRVQNPIRADDVSDPQPDLALVPRRRFRRAHPTPADILLVIEVADTSQVSDRAVKLPLYAKAGIAEAWLIDLPAQIVERYTEPADGHYHRVETAGPGASLSSTVLPALVLPVDEVLG